MLVYKSRAQNSERGVSYQNTSSININKYLNLLIVSKNFPGNMILNIVKI